ncbi:hypothetical protein [Streptomyces sp. NPDC050392]|uniref:hypothetical protein n=1 Tax=Streptomyces sp. NPDC050392 TaxID=3155782 RepID=UPI00342DC6AD
MRRTGTTRRGALTATGAIAMGAVLAGCGSGGDDESSGSRGSARAGARTAADRSSADRAEASLRSAAAGVSASLFAGYEQVARDHPATAAGLAPLRDAVRAHLTALGKGGGGSLGLVRTRPGTGDAAAAVRELAAAERRAAASHTEALLKAPPELARLLASVAAAASAHAYLLTELAKETRA